MDLKKEIENLVEGILNEKGLYLVEIKIANSQHQDKIAVLIDGDEDVSIDTIGEINRALSKELDEAEIINNRYTLEVSSPGLDHPLVLLRQYQKNIGREVKVLLKDNITKKGELLKVNESAITIREKQSTKGKKNTFEEVNLPFSDIKKTNIVASFK